MSIDALQKLIYILYYLTDYLIDRNIQNLFFIIRYCSLSEMLVVSSTFMKFVCILSEHNFLIACPFSWLFFSMLRQMPNTKN